jgi:hypothetical protein
MSRPKVGLKTPVTPGVQTVVSPKSEKNLPTDQDREKEQALPPGAATPNSPSGNEGGGGGGRSVPRYEYNTPDSESDVDKRPRSLPTPGEEYGHPTKYDYNYVTRRDMNAMAQRVAGWWSSEHGTTGDMPADVMQEAVDDIRVLYKGHPELDREPTYGELLDVLQFVTDSARRSGELVDDVAGEYLHQTRMLLEAHNWKPPKAVPPREHQKNQHGDAKQKSKDEYRKNRVQKIREMTKRHKILQPKNKYRELRNDYMDGYRENDDRPYRRRRAEGITFTREQENPKKNIDHPDDNAGYEPTSPSHYRRDKGESHEAPGHGGPNEHLDEASPASSRVVPNGEGQFWQGEETYVKAAGVKVAETISELLAQTEPKVHQRAQKVAVQLKRADPDRGIWTFTAAGSKGNTYTIRIKGKRKGNLRDLSKAEVQVSCSCPYYRWWGPEHWGKVNEYMYGKAQGTQSFPIVRDPGSVRWVCKHAIAALTKAINYRFSSNLVFPRNPVVTPDGDSIRRVADAWLQANTSSIPDSE